jgi:glycosyltransferase involved in cell wall biosynthesis
MTAPGLLFTVFTATLNRRHLLGRVYQALCAQTLQDFEWLIVDDGSTDGTEGLVAEWKAEGRLAIRYFYQTNRGKHRAYNHAIAHANGEFFAVLDSDDSLVPAALERLLHHWNSIPRERRHEFSGVTCLCVDQTGKVVGRPFPGRVLDCRHFEVDTRHGAIGEKWGCHRTAVVRRFPFPEIEGERFCAEGLVWNRIARQFQVRHVNEPLRVYHRHGDALTAVIDRIRIESPHYARQYYQEYLALPLPLRYKLRRLVNYVRFSLHASAGRRDIIREAPHRLLTAAFYPAGWMAFQWDRREAERGGNHQKSWSRKGT